MPEQYTYESDSELDIAIIGMAGRFPGAKNIDEFWYNLEHGIESISFFTDEELESSGVDPKIFKDRNYIRARGILDDVDMFDAAFFGFFPKEAEQLDPQHRLFLEHAWEAIENAGYNIESFNYPVGVFGGIGMNTYILPLLSTKRGRFDAAEGYLLSVGNEKDFLTTKVSYKLNLQGPSIVVQTACSTSLVAVYLACQSLLSYQCDIALAGGATIALPQKSGYRYQEGMILSPDGHCRAFDAKANGTIAGNGVGVVVLKRCEDSIADGDHIYAVIKGTACNNDGTLRVGYTAPSVDGQAEVIASAQAMAGVDPESISYIEAHGTGTTLGDPIEIAALTRVFREKTTKKQFCAIGSAKTNVGHLDAAAGVTGLIKTALALDYKKIPPSLNFDTPNPRIDFANSPFFVNTKLAEWKTDLLPRRAGVSSFGIGGTNVHAVLEEAPVPIESGKSRPYQLLLLSAKTDSALEKAMNNFVDYMGNNPDSNLADIAYTLQTGRQVFNKRCAAICQSNSDAAKILEKKDPQRLLYGFHQQDIGEKSVVFMFSGQGAQYVGMSRELYQTEVTFKDQVDLCSQILQPIIGMDLRDVVFPNDIKNEECQKTLSQTFITQPALFVIEYAMAKQWMEWGIKPHAMIGHSIGEYVAACLAGVLSLPDALHLVAKRGALMQGMPPGAMLSVPLGAKEIRTLLTDDLSLAGTNTDSLCVVSGKFSAIENLEGILTTQKIAFRRLHTSHAFHSSMMDPIIEPFKKEVKKVQLNLPNIPYISNVTGTWITAEQATDPNYYALHLRQPVRFSHGIQELLKHPDNILLEVGPGKTLNTFARRHPSSTPETVILSSLRHPQETQSDLVFMLTTLARLWLANVKIDWYGFYKHERRLRIPLPTYPFDRQRYWLDVKESQQDREDSSFSAKRSDIKEWFYTPSWKRSDISHYSKNNGEKYKWLLFLNSDVFSTTVIEKFKQEEYDFITVQTGTSFQEHESNRFTINPKSSSDYERLLSKLKDSEWLPHRIIHFWNFEEDNNTSLTIEKFNEYQYIGFYSLIYFVQALGKLKITSPMEFMVVSRGLYEVTGEENLSPQKATLLGPCKVIPQEYPNIQCRNVDFPIVENEPAIVNSDTNIIFAEFQTSSSDLVVAHRGKHRWVQCYEFHRPNENSLKLRENGVYLITGGLGNIGLLLAEYLAKNFQAKLVLIDRIKLPVRNDWPLWLSDRSNNDIIASKITKLQALEEQGAKVLTINADVADQNEMKAAIDKTYRQFGVLHGVIHAAGIVGPESMKTIQELKSADCESQFRVKVHSTLILNELLRDKQLDFIILQSSLSTILGGLGLCAYAAANFFLDSVAGTNSQKQGINWKSVNWDGWQLTKEVPLDSSKLGIHEYAILPDEGIQTFHHILEHIEQPQIIVSTGDLQERIKRWVTFKTAPVEDTKKPKSEKETSENRYPRPNLPTPYVAPRNDIEETIVELWEDLLGIEEIGIHDNFFELGGHSLLATRLISQLRDMYNVELPLRDLFESPTIVTLGISIAENLESKQSVTSNEITKIQETLKIVEQLSEDEVKAILQENKNQDAIAL